MKSKLNVTLLICYKVCPVMNSYGEQHYNESISRFYYIAKYELWCMAKLMIGQVFVMGPTVDHTRFLKIY